MLRKSVLTQTVSLVDQLNCGARALDLRLVNEHGRVHFHHGEKQFLGVPLYWTSRDQTLSGELPSLVQWSKEHPEELALLLVSHCVHYGSDDKITGNGDCTTADGIGDVSLSNIFKEHGIYFESDCNKLNSMTLETAKDLAKLPGSQGMLMAITAGSTCVTDNYDPKINLKSAVGPYVQQKMAEAHEKMFQVQAFIQQKGIHVPLDASLNDDVLAWVQGGMLTGVNLLEINSVCARGTDISAALGASVTVADFNTCTRACKNGCSKYDKLPQCGRRLQEGLMFV